MSVNNVIEILRDTHRLPRRPGAGAGPPDAEQLDKLAPALRHSDSGGNYPGYVLGCIRMIGAVSRIVSVDRDAEHPVPVC